MRTELQLVLQPEGWGAALSMHVSCRCRFDSSILMRLPESCRIGPGSTLETLGLVLSELCHSAAMPASSKISESTGRSRLETSGPVVLRGISLEAAQACDRIGKSNPCSGVDPQVTWPPAALAGQGSSRWFFRGCGITRWDCPELEGKLQAWGNRLLPTDFTCSATDPQTWKTRRVKR